MRPARWRSRRLLLLSLGGALILASGVVAPEARGHASLLETSPPPGAQLADPPSQIALLYTEPLNARLTSVGLVEVGGGKVDASTRVTAGRRLELRPRRRLAQGAYRLEWRSVSTLDGHIREGSVGFGVGTASVGGAFQLEQGPLDGFGPARAAIRWLFYAALFFFAGGLFNAVLRRGGQAGAWLTPDPSVADPAIDRGDVARTATRRTVRAGWLAAIGSVAVVAVETLDAADGGWQGARDFLLMGNAGISRLILMASLIAAAAVARRKPRVAAALTALALLAAAQGGHAAGVQPAALAVATDWVHLVAAAVWMGGIAQLAWAWLPSLWSGSREIRRAVLAGVLVRFGRVALPAFLAVAVTGLLNAVLQLGAIEELWESGYGRLLAAKMMLVALVAGLSYLHAFRLRPRLLRERPGAPPDPRAQHVHRRLLASEVPVGIAILAVAALLVGFPVPPRELRDAEARAVVRPCEPCPFARPQRDELAVARPAGRLTAAAWLQRATDGVSGTLRVIDGKRRPAPVKASIDDATYQRPCGRGCWRFSISAAAPFVQVTVEGAEADRRAVRLRAMWDPSGDRRARRILARAQRSMRRLTTLRQVETVQSAAASQTRGRVEFRFQAPDRMRYETAQTASVVIGRRAWVRSQAAPTWEALTPADAEFRVRDAFRWTVFASTARLLGVRSERNRRVADIALLDWGYPLWYTITVDVEADRVLRQVIVTPENRIEDRYFAFDRPLTIGPPTGSTAGAGG